MIDEAKQELNEMSIEELFNLLEKADELKGLAESKLGNNDDSKKRGTSN